jgi:hypothetical protein
MLSKPQLEKLAKSVPTKTKARVERAKKEELADKYVGGVQGASLGLGLGTMALIRGPELPGGKQVTLERVVEMGRKMGLPVDDMEQWVHVPKWYDLEKSWNPFYDPLDKVVNIPTKTRDAVIAHELGHLKNDVQVASKWGAKVRIPYHIIDMISRIGSGVALGPTLYEAATQKGKDLSYKPGVIQAILSSPMLAEEAAASVRATAMLMKEHGALKGGAKALPLLPAFGTYAMVAGSPLLVTYLRKKAIEKKMEGKEKKSDGMIPGGLAAKKRVRDFDKRSLLKGMKVEQEHSPDPRIQLEIAMDHLTEDPDYYEKLEKMER